MTDAYYIQKYGISLAEREALMKEQDYKCPGCGRDLRECRLEVDHEHVTLKMITALRYDSSAPYARHGKSWAAYVTLSGGRKIEAHAGTKTDAIAKVKQAAKRASVRGVMCGGRYAGCNRKIGRIDNVGWLNNIVKYLNDPPARRILE